MMKAKSINRTVFFRYVRRHPMMYLMLIPGLFFLFIYKFAPLYGILLHLRITIFLQEVTRLMQLQKARGWDLQILNGCLRVPNL